MAETDILNPTRGYWDELGDNPNWNYGWVRKTSTNKQIAKPRLGRRYSREILNGGYSGNLLYVDRPYSTVLYLKKFFEQFQGGYFTLIDRDGGTVITSATSPLSPTRSNRRMGSTPSRD